MVREASESGGLEVRSRGDQPAGPGPRPKRQAADNPSPPARGARTAQGERSREQLLRAAVDLISERGYAGTSVGDVCARAGVAKTALYWHFDSKEGLLAAVVEHVGSSWIEEIQRSVYREGEPLQRLDRLIESWRAILVEQPKLLRLLLVVQLERSESSEQTRAAMKAVWDRAEHAIIEGIQDTIGVPIPDPDLVAHSMLTLMYGAMLRLLIDPDGTDLDRLFGEFRRTVVLTINSRLPPELRVGPDVLAPT